MHQSVIILSRRLLERKYSGDSGKSRTEAKKVSGLSVVSGLKPTPAQEKQSKLSAAEELVFLCEFGTDIVYSVSSFIAAVQQAGNLAQSNLLW